MGTVAAATAAATSTPAEGIFSQEARPAESPAAAGAPCDSSGSGGSSVTGSGSGRSSGSSNSGKLVLQCGPHAVVQLTFGELVALSGAAVVSDVADAPGGTIAISTYTSSPAAAAGAGGIGAGAAGSPASGDSGLTKKPGPVSRCMAGVAEPEVHQHQPEMGSRLDVCPPVDMVSYACWLPPA